MKHIILCLLAIAALTGCSKNDTPVDQGPYEVFTVSRYVWVNDSDHRIAMSAEGTYDFGTEEIAPGTRLEKESGGIGHVTLSTYLRNGIAVVFDDGPYGGFFVPHDANSPQPNIADMNLYEFEEYRNDLGADIAEWTYTFTNADYEAAVARGPMTQD